MPHAITAAPVNEAMWQDEVGFIGKEINIRKLKSLPILADFNNNHANIKVRGYT